MIKNYFKIVKLVIKIFIPIFLLSFFSIPNPSQASAVVVSFTEVGEHTWTVPAGVTSVDVLVVGGGGGGGRRHGAGGGAGGLIFEENYEVNSGENINISVGQGGVGATGTGAQATNGENSSFNNLIAIGGGAGGQWDNFRNGLDGGSGGGSSSLHISNGVVGQGNNGGAGATASSPYNWGGGGGAGEPGGSATSEAHGSGGDGLYYGNIYGNEYGEDGWFAGGGGGGGHNPNALYRGLGGMGGGGNGGTPNTQENGANGLINTGGGGGGASTTSGGSNIGGNGGSGIVLIRYYKSLNLNNNLVGHFKLNQDNYSTPTVFDSSPYSNNGTNFGATFTKDRFGNEGGAMSFDGNNYIISNSVLADGSSGITWSVWVNLINNTGFILDQRESNIGYQPMYINNGRLQFYSSDTNDNSYFNNKTLTTGNWYHISMVLSGGKVKYFVDGKYIEEKNDTQVDFETKDLHIGTRHNISDNILGSIFDVRIYNRALSEEEIKLLASYEPREENNIRGVALLKDSEEYIFFNCLDEEGGTFPFQFPFILGGDPCKTVHAGLITNYGVNLDYNDYTFSGFARHNNGGLISFRSGIPDEENYNFVNNCLDTDPADCNADNNCSACYDEESGYIFGWARDLNSGDWIDLGGDGLGIYNSGNNSGIFFGEAEHESLGEIRFNCEEHVGDCGNYNNYKVWIWPLDIRELSAPNWSFANACSADGALRAILRWERRSGFQTHFEVMINTENNTSTAWTSGKIPSSASQLICPGSNCPGSVLDYSTSYYWWLKLYDDNSNQETDWVQFNTDNENISSKITDNIGFNSINNPSNPNLSFTTYRHEFPKPDFRWQDYPEVNFIAGTSTDFWVHDDTKYYNESHSEIMFTDPGFANNFLWLASPAGEISIINATSTETGIIFESIGPNQRIFLILTDPTGYYCTKESIMLTINYDLPIWREVKAE